jgi:hypothetical protein
MVAGLYANTRAKGQTEVLGSRVGELSQMGVGVEVREQCSEKRSYVIRVANNDQLSAQCQPLRCQRDHDRGPAGEAIPIRDDLPLPSELCAGVLDRERRTYVGGA